MEIEQNNPFGPESVTVTSYSPTPKLLAVEFGGVLEKPPAKGLPFFFQENEYDEAPPDAVTSITALSNPVSQTSVIIKSAVEDVDPEFTTGTSGPNKLT